MALLILAVNGEEHPSWLLAHTLMEDFRSQVSGPIQEAYPEDYVESRRKSGGMLSFSIGLHSDSNEGIEEIVDRYVSLTSGAEVEVVTNLGYYTSDMNRLIRTVHYFLWDFREVHRVDTRRSKTYRNVIDAGVKLRDGVPLTVIDDLTEQAQQVIYNSLGRDTSLRVSVRSDYSINWTDYSPK